VTLGPFPRCFHCDCSEEVVYAQRGNDLYYCGPCWKHFLAKEKGDWERCRPTLSVANPPCCPECSGPGPCFLEAGVQGGSWCCGPCWGAAMPARVLQFPSPLLQWPTAPRNKCTGLIASDYRIVAENCGIWSTVERNMAILRQCGATVLNNIDAFHVDELFPKASMVVWAAPHWHVADARASCSPHIKTWSSNDDFNTEAFEMLQRKLPGAEVLIPFPAHYSRAAAAPQCRSLLLPELSGVTYRPLCSDPRWYQTLTSTDDVVCLSTAEFLSEVSVVNRVKQHLEVGGVRTNPCIPLCLYRDRNRSESKLVGRPITQ